MMIAPPGPVVDPGGNSAPNRDEDTPMGINLSPTWRMMIRLFALRNVAASAAMSFACQSGLTMSTVTTDGSDALKLFLFL
jgi:hypothetical protein